MRSFYARVVKFLCDSVIKRGLLRPRYPVGANISRSRVSDAYGLLFIFFSHAIGKLILSGNNEDCFHLLP